MGFGYNLLFVFIIIPSTILLIAWLLTKNHLFGMALKTISLGILTVSILSYTIIWLSSPMSIKKKDYHGEYVVNRKYFRGSQADWQYDNFRFEINENDSIYFYVTNEAKIIKTYKGIISTIKAANYQRLVIEMESPSHHILVDNPTVIRKAWNFQLIFYSPKFHNVFFEKGNWQPINVKSGKIGLRSVQGDTAIVK